MGQTPGIVQSLPHFTLFLIVATSTCPVAAGGDDQWAKSDREELQAEPTPMRTEQLTERAQINEAVVAKCQAELTEVEKEQARPAAERDGASAAGSGGVIAANQHDPARIGFAKRRQSERI